MSNELAPECLVHKDNRNVQVRLDYILLYKNEPKAKIIRILETWTNHKYAEWYKATADSKEQGNAPPEEDLWVTMSYAQFSVFIYGTTQHETIKQYVDDLVELGHIERRPHPTFPYGPPQYLLKRKTLQDALDKLDIPSSLFDLAPLFLSPRKKHTPQEKYPQGRGKNPTREGALLPPGTGEISPPSNKHTKNAEKGTNNNESTRAVSANATTAHAHFDFAEYQNLPIPVTYAEALAYLKPHGPHDELDAVEVMQLARKLWTEAQIGEGETDGSTVDISGDRGTGMAGLDCGEPVPEPELDDEETAERPAIRVGGNEHAPLATHADPAAAFQHAARLSGISAPAEDTGHLRPAALQRPPSAAPAVAQDAQNVSVALHAQVSASKLILAVEDRHSPPASARPPLAEATGLLMTPQEDTPPPVGAHTSSLDKPAQHVELLPSPLQAVRQQAGSEHSPLTAQRPAGAKRSGKAETPLMPRVGPPPMPPEDEVWGFAVILAMFDHWRGHEPITPKHRTQCNQCAVGLYRAGYSRPLLVEIRNIMKDDPYYANRFVDICDAANNAHKYKPQAERNLKQKASPAQAEERVSDFDIYVGNGPEARRWVVEEGMKLVAQGKYTDM